MLRSRYTNHVGVLFVSNMLFNLFQLKLPNRYCYLACTQINCFVLTIRDNLPEPLCSRWSGERGKNVTNAYYLLYKSI